jgi:hypothetical protein
LLRLGLGQFLPGLVPAGAGHGPILAARLQAQVHLQHGRTELQVEDRLPGQRRLAHGDAVGVGQHRHPVGLRAQQAEIPVGGVELHQLFVADAAVLHFRADPGALEQLGDCIAVAAVEKVGALAAHRQLHGRVPAMHHQLRRAGLAHFQLLAGDDAPEQHILPVAGAGADFDLGPGRQAGGVRQREVAGRRRAVLVDQPRVGDAVHHGVDRHGQQVLPARDLLAVGQHREGAVRARYR